MSVSNSEQQLPPGYDLVQRDVEDPTRGLRGDLLLSRASSYYVLQTHGGFFAVSQAPPRRLDVNPPTKNTSGRRN